MKQHEQARLLFVLDALTPFGTTFRYDVLPIAHDFHRVDARDMVRRLRMWAERIVIENG